MVNPRDRNFTKQQLRRTIQRLDEDIDRYLKEKDEDDAQEPQEKRLTISIVIDTQVHFNRHLSLLYPVSLRQLQNQEQVQSIKIRTQWAILIPF